MDSLEAKLAIKGIKCDNTKCDYIDPEVKYEEYKEWLNKPCPCCGENLLTQADFDSLNVFIESFGIELVDDIENVDNKLIVSDIKMNGTGKLELGEMKDAR